MPCRSELITLLLLLAWSPTLIWLNQQVWRSTQTLVVIESMQSCRPDPIFGWYVCVFNIFLNASASEPITERTGLVTSGDIGPSLDCKGQSLSCLFPRSGWRRCVFLRHQAGASTGGAPRSRRCERKTSRGKHDRSQQTLLASIYVLVSGAFFCRGSSEQRYWIQGNSADGSKLRKPYEPKTKGGCMRKQWPHWYL